jgi:hypothetical protein
MRSPIETDKLNTMRNESRKYYIANIGSFAMLDDKEFNELCGYELSLLQVPAVLYVRDGYHYKGSELLFSHQELKSIIQTTLQYSIN